jgi:hypothetical protein
MRRRPPVRLRLRPLRDRSSVRKSARLKRGASQVRFLPVTSSRLRSSTRQSSRFLPGTVQVRRLPGPLAPLAGGLSRPAELPAASHRARDAKEVTEGLPPARYPVSKTGGLSGFEGSTPSPSASRHRPAPPPARRSRAPASPRAAERTGRSGSVLAHYPLRPGTLSAAPETRGALAEAWPSWEGSALLPRRRRQSRSQVRVLLPPLFVPA